MGTPHRCVSGDLSPAPRFIAPVTHGERVPSIGFNCRALLNISFNSSKRFRRITRADPSSERIDGSRAGAQRPALPQLVVPGARIERRLSRIQYNHTPRAMPGPRLEYRWGRADSNCSESPEPSTYRSNSSCSVSSPSRIRACSNPECRKSLPAAELVAPGWYVTSGESTLPVALTASRSHCTPSSISITALSAARSEHREMRSPSAVPRRTSGRERPCPAAHPRRPPERPRRVSVETDGRLFPVSTCESRLGETASSCAALRRLIPRIFRISRMRSPMDSVLDMRDSRVR